MKYETCSYCRWLCICVKLPSVFGKFSLLIRKFSLLKVSWVGDFSLLGEKVQCTWKWSGVDPPALNLTKQMPFFNINENLGWTPNLDSFFYFVQKYLEVELLEVLPAAHFIMDWRQIRQGRSFPGMISRNKTSWFFWGAWLPIPSCFWKLFRHH